MIWRWYSTVESAKNLEFSLMAFIESLAAISLSLWFAWEFQTELHIAVGALLAPFLLLSTEESTARGLRYFETSFDKLGFFVQYLLWYLVGGSFIIISVYFIWGINTFIFIIIYLLIAVAIVYWILEDTLFWKKLMGEEEGTYVGLENLVIGGVSGIGVSVGIVAVSMLAKISATLISLVQHPVKSIRQIPLNWSKFLFSIDILHPPEIIPGIEQSNYLILNSMKFSQWVDQIINSFGENKGFIDKFDGFISLLLAPIIFLPALIYRWSLKSSSIIWLPLIFVIGWRHSDAKTENLRLQDKLKAIRETVIVKVQVFYALIAIFLLTLLPIMLTGQANQLLKTIAPKETALHNLLSYFFAFQMDSWHWSRLGASVLTLILFFYADRLLLKRQTYSRAGLQSAPYLIRTITLFRTPLSLFTIACGLYLLLNPIDWQQQLQNMEWLPLDIP